MNIYKNIIKSKKAFWLSVSVIYSLYFAIFSWQYAFSQQYLIQDDVRIHIVWLQRFIDPALFSNDFLANYFIYFAPWGFKVIYWFGTKIGIEPLILAKIMPGFLGLITAIYVYLFTLKILPKPFSAFLASLMMTQLLWTNDDLISATPRAFVYPLFAAFLYYLATEKLLFCLVSMFVLGLFYPQVLLVEIAVLGTRLLTKSDRFFELTTKIQPYQWFFCGIIVSAIALFPFSQRTPEWSNVVTATQMQQLPEFNENGRTYFYGVGWLKFIFAGDSGLCLPNFPPIIWLGFTLPLFLKQPLSTIKSLTVKINILWQVITASLLMFVAAHLLLLKIHLPSRYTYHTLRFVLAVSFAIVITVLIEISINWLQKQTKLEFLNQVVIVASVSFLTVAFIFPAIPLVFNEWMQNWRIGHSPAIYEYLKQQPKDITIASLSNEANYIPAFSLRSILVSEEFAFPYHPYYYREIEQRAADLIKAQYATDTAVLNSFIDKYSVDFIFIDKTAFVPQYLQDKNWLVYSSWQNVTEDAIALLETKTSLVLPPLIKACSVVSTPQANLLDTKCITKKL